MKRILLFITLVIVWILAWVFVCLVIKILDHRTTEGATKEEIESDDLIGIFGERIGKDEEYREWKEEIEDKHKEAM